MQIYVLDVYVRRATERALWQQADIRQATLGTHGTVTPMIIMPRARHVQYRSHFSSSFVIDGSIWQCQRRPAHATAIAVLTIGIAPLDDMRMLSSPARA